MKFVYSLLIAAFAATLTLQAQTPTLLKDINTGMRRTATRPTSSGTETRCYSEPTPPQSGTELWITDGTPAGTMLLKDINTDPTRFSGSSNPDNFTCTRARLTSTARSGDLGRRTLRHRRHHRRDGAREGHPARRRQRRTTRLHRLRGSAVLHRQRRHELLGVVGDRRHEAGTRLAVDINPAGGTGIPTWKSSSRTSSSSGQRRHAGRELCPPTGPRGDHAH